MSALLNSDLLEDLHTQVADDAYQLYEALAVIADDSSDDAAVTEALGDCAGYLQHVSDYAARAQLSGLQEICQVLQQNLLATQASAILDREVLCGEVEHWPRLIANYLHQPTDEHTQVKLVNQLQQASWHQPLSDDDVSVLSAQLAEDSSTLVTQTEAVADEVDSFTALADDDAQALALDSLADTTDRDDLAAETSDALGSDEEFTGLVESEGELLDELPLADETYTPPPAPVAATDDESLSEDLALENAADWSAEELDAQADFSDLDQDDNFSLETLADLELAASENAELSESPVLAEDALTSLGDDLPEDDGLAGLAELDDSLVQDDELPADLDESELVASAEFDDELPADLDESELVASTEFDDELSTDLDESELATSAEFDDEFPTDLDESELVASAEFDDELPTDLDESELVASAEFDDELPADLDESELVASADFDDELPTDLDESELAESADFDDELPADLDESELAASAEFDDELPTDLDESELVASAEFDDELPTDLDESELVTSAEFDDELPADLDESELVASADFDDELPTDLDESELAASAEFDDELSDSLDELDLPVDAEFDDELSSELEGDLPLLDTDDSMLSTEDSTDEFALPEEVDAFSAEDTLPALEDEHLLDDEILDQPDLNISEGFDTSDADTEEEQEQFSNANVSLNTSESNRLLDEATFGELDHDDWSLPEETDTAEEELLDEAESFSDEMEDEDEHGELSVLLPDEELDTMIDEASFADISHEQEVLDENALTSTESDDDAEAATTEESLTRFGIGNKFEQLSNQIVGSSDTLANALQQFVTTDEESETFLLAIEEYTNEVQGLWELAEVSQLKGVQDVCTFINDNLFELSTQSQPVRFAAHELFAAWPRLVLEYLQAPKEGAGHLVQHLQNEQWPQPLTEKVADDLKKQLIQETIVAKIEYSPNSSVLHTGQTLEPPHSTRFSADELENLEATAITPSPVEPTPEPSEATDVESTDTDDTPAEATALTEDEDLEQEETSGQADYEFTRSDLGGAFIDDDVLLASEMDFEADDDLLAETDAADDSTDLPELPDDASLTALDDLDALPALEDEDSSEVDDAELSSELDALDASDLPELSDLEESDLSNNSELDELELPEVSDLDALDDLPEVSESFDDAELPTELTDLDDTLATDLDEVADLADEDEALTEEELAALSDSMDDALTTGLNFTPEPAVAEDELQLVDADTLDTLRQEIAEAISDFNNAKLSFLSEPDDSEELLEAVGRCTDNVQSIYDACEREGVAGIPDVCGFINENIFELSSHGHAIRRAAAPYLDAWPDLVLQYLSAPLATAPLLVSHLSSTGWPSALDEERAQHLLAVLTQGQLGELSESEQDATLAEVVTDDSALDDFASEVLDDAELTDLAGDLDSLPEAEPLVIADPDVLLVLSGQIADSAEGLENILNDLVHADGEDVLTQAESYTEHVQEIWEAADMAGLQGVQTVCMFVNDNIMGLAAQEPEERQAAQEAFSEWPGHVLSYLEQPETGALSLADYLQQVTWPMPLDEEAAASLQQQLLTPASPPQIEFDDVADLSEDEFYAEALPEESTEINTSTADTTEVEATPLVLADEDILMVLTGQVVDTAEALETSLSLLVAAEEGSEDALMEASNYSEHVQALWDAAEMAGLSGLQTVCTFVNDNVMLFAALDADMRQQAQPVFTAWPDQVSQYLTEPRQGAIALTQLLQDARWPQPLADDEAADLQQQLLTPANAAGAEVAAEAEAVEEAPIVLADPDILMILIGQVVDSTDELNATLAQLVDAEDGSEDSLMAASTYTEQVQALWDAADMAGLTGLQTVCTFVNDNVMQFAALEQSMRQQTQAVFADWPVNVQNYLESPATGALTLVEQLQDFRWPQALEPEAAEDLLPALLNRQAPSTSAAPDVAETELVLAAPETIELLRGQINDIMPELTAALEECVVMETDNPAFLEAIEQYTNQVQAIWDAADMAGLQGLQEVCTFVNDNLMMFGAQDAAQRQAARQPFEQWPALLLDYLSMPQSGATQLVAALQAETWPQPLAADQAENLLNLLLQPSASAVQQAAYETEVAMQDEVAEVEEEDEGSSEPLAELDVDVEGGGEISLGNAEAVEMLTSELESSKEELAEELAKFLSLENGAAGYEEAAENYADIVMRLNMAAEMLGLDGLQAVSLFVAENVRQLSEKDKATRNKAKKWLEAWPEQVLAYLQSPQEHVIALVNNFRESEWARPLSDETAHALLNQLMQGSTTEEDPEEEAAYARQTDAKPEDVLITVPEDVNQDLLEAYLQEAPQHAADFSECIQNIIAEPQVKEIERAQRIAHTLKGSSNIIGIKGIANIAHHLEDTLEYLAQKQVVPPPELTETMVEAADCLESMVDCLLGQDDAPENALQVLQAVLNWANQIDKGKLSAPPVSAKAAAPASSEDGDAAAVPAKAAAKAPAAGGATSGAPEQFLRVPTRTVDDLMRLVGELSIAAGQIQERLRHVTGSTRLLIDQSMILQQKTFELENLVDVRGITGVENRYAQLAEEDEHFDPLEFEEYNELHSVAHSFIESIADSRELALSIRGDLAELESMFIQQERLNKEFQATIMTTRMVPVATVVSKLQRNVRQTCRATGKQAELDVIGTDIMIDSDVLDKLADPLMHILRNSIDHGIEAADERAILGKPESGTIVLKFYREGNNIVVSCKDDGAGLNYANIRYTAIQRGLITENQELTEPELARLILMSGFSTKSGVTQVSGRGVGMDVVHTNIREMKGTLDIMSETGHGTLMSIKLPMSLVTVHILLVRVGQQRYGIPTNHLEQVLAAGVSEFHEVAGEVTVKMGKNFFPVKALSDLLGVPADKPGIEGREHRPLALVHEETGTTAVVLDELLDTHDLVMKTMGKYVKNIHGVAGASILGDGSLVPLLDLPQLLRSPMQAAMNSYMAEQGIDLNAMAGPAGLPKVLIVDDSLSVRKSLSILVEDAGFEVLLAKDGVEAIEVMSQSMPNVMLVDMEMPRMNGLELTSHVRANPQTERLPVFMITSRTTEKHREQAKTAGVSAYLTKPYQDTELLDLIDKGLAGKI